MEKAKLKVQPDWCGRCSSGTPLAGEGRPTKGLERGRR